MMPDDAGSVKNDQSITGIGSRFYKGAQASRVNGKKGGGEGGKCVGQVKGGTREGSIRPEWARSGSGRTQINQGQMPGSTRP